VCCPGSRSGPSCSSDASRGLQRRAPACRQPPCSAHRRADAWRGCAQTRQRAYVKDLDLSFHPFLPILGTGLVTADGPLWQRQRLLIGTALRVDILDDVVRPCFSLCIPQSASSPVCRRWWAVRGALLQNTARMPCWSARTNLSFIATRHQKQAPSWRLLRAGGRRSARGGAGVALACMDTASCCVHGVDG